MRIEDSTDPTPSTSGIYAEYEVKSIPNPLFGYVEKVLSPWVKKRYKLSLDGLHEEILDVYHWLRPSKVETALRYSVFDRVKAVIYEKWKEYNIQVSVFGSLRTNLFLPTSDIDVLVECAAWKDVIPILNETAEALKTSGMAETISVYPEAFVPIVKMVDKDTLVSIDISFNTVQGVRAADYIEKVKEEFPVVEPLILILKQFLIQRNLNQTFTGGLSSYGLILMLISFLQMYAMPVRRKSFYDYGVNLGELLMRFFEVYAQEFNYLEVGISVEDCRYKKKNNSLDFKSPVLSLEDPLLRSNEVGRSTFNFAGVQTSFAQALQVLKGVFVRDRRKNTDFNELIFKSGSMLALIMPFTTQQVEYRCWLKSQSLSQRQDTHARKIERADKMRTPLLVTNTCISPYINLDTVTWNQHPPPVKTPKPLSILPPSEKKSAEPTESSLPINEKNKKKDASEIYVNSAPKKETEQPTNEKENGDRLIKKSVSPRKDDSTKKDVKGKKVTDSYSYSSAVHKNTKKHGEAKLDKVASNHNNSVMAAKKSESDSVNGTKRQSGSESKKTERRPDITYYNPAARSHRNQTPKANGNLAAHQAQNSDADSEQDSGFTTVVGRRR